MTLAPCPQCGTNTTPGTACASCGTPTPAPFAAAAGDPYIGQWEAILAKLQTVTAPRYVVKGILGYGGMAGVYLADEPRLGRKVAIKVMAPGLMIDPKLVERFEQEARTIAQLSHPNIITIYEVDEREDLHWFTMTYVAGRTLGQVLNESVEPLPIPVVCSWLYQIGDALAFAHNHGVVHRDIKPGNVLIDLRGNALVTDFGIAKVADSDAGLTRTGLLVGTPAYMSPEQCSSGAISGASDQYSLGTVAYQMLTGQPPFSGQTLAVLQAHMAVEPTPIQELRPDCPDELAHAITGMLQKRPEERWESMTAAVQALGAGPAGLEGSLRDQLKLLATQTVRIKAPGFPETVREGNRELLPVQLQDTSGRALPPRRVEWTSSDPTIACVSSDHMLLALSPGTAYLGAYSGAASLSLRIVVEPDAVRAINIRTVGPLAVGELRTLEVDVLDIDESPLAGRAVLWTSSDPKIAAVSLEGVVQGIGAGSVTLTARTGSVSADTTLVVTPARREATTTTMRQMHASQVRASVAKSLPGLTPAPMTTAAPTPAPANKRRMAAIVGAAVLVVAVVGAVVVLKPAGSDHPTTLNPQVTDPPAAQPPVSAGTGNDANATPGAPPAATTVDANPVSGGPAPQPVQPQPRPTQPQPAGPVAGDVVLQTTGLPEGASLTVTDANGAKRTFDRPRMSLDAGRYVLEFTAPGYLADTKTITLRAGDAITWTPALAKVAAPVTPVQEAPRNNPPPPQPVTPVVDTKADEADIRARVNEFVATFSNRDRNVLNIVPASENDLRLLITAKGLNNFKAGLRNVSTPSIAGGTATVPFTMSVAFRADNQNQENAMSLIARLEKTSKGWELLSVRLSGN